MPHKKACPGAVKCASAMRPFKTKPLRSCTGNKKKGNQSVKFNYAKINKQVKWRKAKLKAKQPENQNQTYIYSVGTEESRK